MSRYESFDNEIIKLFIALALGLIIAIYSHEFGHAIGAILTGGSVTSITLNPLHIDGSVQTSGGDNIVVLLLAPISTYIVCLALLLIGKTFSNKFDGWPGRIVLVILVFDLIRSATYVSGGDTWDALAWGLWYFEVADIVAIFALGLWAWQQAKTPSIGRNAADSADYL